MMGGNQSKEDSPSKNREEWGRYLKGHISVYITIQSCTQL